MAVASLAVLIGTSEAVQAASSLEAMAATFDPASSSKSAAKFDPSELDVLNRQIVHELPYAAVAERLAAAGIDPSDPRAETFWTVIRANVEKVADAGAWWAIVTQGPASEATLEGEDLDYARQAFDMLPEGEVGSTTWSEWTAAVKEATGRKGRGLFMPAAHRAYRTDVRAGDRRSIASSGSGRNSGPTTLTLRFSADWTSPAGTAPGQFADAFLRQSGRRVHPGFRIGEAVRHGLRRRHRLIAGVGVGCGIRLRQRLAAGA